MTQPTTEQQRIIRTTPATVITWLSGALLVVTTGIVVGFGINAGVRADSWFTFGLAVAVVMWIGGIVSLAVKVILGHIAAENRAVRKRQAECKKEIVKEITDAKKAIIATALNARSDRIRASSELPPTGLRSV